MKPFSLFIGLWLITIGIVATLADDLVDQLWWLAACGLVAAGLSGLITAVPRRDTDTDTEIGAGS